MTGYKAVTHARPEPNRGSVIWVRECYLNRMVRVYDAENRNIGSEVIHLLMDTLPPTNIIGVYQETGKGKDNIENAHKVLRNRVKKVEERDKCLSCWVTSTLQSMTVQDHSRKKYTGGQLSDHKAQKVTLMLDIVKKGKEGNRAIINYNNKEGWILYKSC